MQSSLCLQVYSCPYLQCRRGVAHKEKQSSDNTARKSLSCKRNSCFSSKHFTVKSVKVWNNRDLLAELLASTTLAELALIIARLCNNKAGILGSGKIGIMDKREEKCEQLLGIQVTHTA